MSEIPHFSFPFRFATPQAATSEQDSLDEIADCVWTILLCPLGFRVELPTFGIDDPTFSTPEVDIDLIRRAVEAWEERALVAFDQHPDQFDALIQRVQTTVRVRTEE